MSRQEKALLNLPRYGDNKKRKNFYLTTRPRSHSPTRRVNLPTVLSRRGRAAVQASWAAPSEDFLQVETTVCPKIIHAQGFYEARRQAIFFIYAHLLDHPPLSSDLCDKICGLLFIPKESRRHVSATIRKIIESIESKEAFSGKCKRIWTDHLMVELSPQAHVVYRCVLDDLSINDTVCRVNTWRLRQDPPLKRLSYSTMQRFISASECIKSTIRKKVKSGTTDADSEWAEGK